MARFRESGLRGRRDAVIAQLYEGALDGTGWARSMDMLADLVGAADSSLGAAHSEGIPWLVAPRTDPDWLGDYYAYHDDDLFWQRLVRGPSGHSTIDAQLLDRDELSANRFQHEWSEPQGYRYKMGVALAGDDGWNTVLVLPGVDPFDRQAARMLDTIVPHLRRALMIERRIGKGVASEALGKALLEHCPSAAIILDGSGRILSASDTTQRWFAEGLSIVDGRLRGCAEMGTPDTVRLASGRRLHILPLQAPAGPRWADIPAALVVASMPTEEEQGAILQYHYGLTRAEAALALELRRGDGRRAAARRRGIRDTTARTHHSRIFDKLCVARQGEAVAAINRLLA